MACPPLDVAIVGGGVSGCYTAYRLRHTKQRVALFETSNRIGGRLYTYRLPCSPTVDLDLGAMRFIPKYHRRVDALAKELGLPVVPFPSNKHSDQTKTVYYLRGSHFDEGDITSGELPYALRQDEKENRHRPWQYYFEKLTGIKVEDIDQDLVHLKSAVDGTPLHRLKLTEALSHVASDEGRAYLEAWLNLSTPRTISIYFFYTMAVFDPHAPLACLQDGMASLPRSLHHAFQQASNTHETHFNQKLVSITKVGSELYSLRFQLTSTDEDDTTRPLSDQFIETTARRVILALPLTALDDIQWPPLQEPRFQNARSYAVSKGLSKVYLVYDTPWWREESDGHYTESLSDQPYGVSHDFGQRDGKFVLLAMYSHCEESFRALQSQGDAITGSAPGDLRVSVAFYDWLVDQLATSFKIPRHKIPEPIGGVAKFWDISQYGKGVLSWGSGCLDEGVLDAVKRPSTVDNVAVVGADLAIDTACHVWTEGALQVVDEVLGDFDISTR